MHLSCPRPHMRIYQQSRRAIEAWSVTSLGLRRSGATSPGLGRELGRVVGLLWDRGVLIIITLSLSFSPSLSLSLPLSHTSLFLSFSLPFTPSLSHFPLSLPPSLSHHHTSLSTSPSLYLSLSPSLSLFPSLPLSPSLFLGAECVITESKLSSSPSVSLNSLPTRIKLLCTV